LSEPLEPPGSGLDSGARAAPRGRAADEPGRRGGGLVRGPGVPRRSGRRGGRQRACDSV